MSLLSSRQATRTIVVLSLAIFVFLLLALPVPSSVSKHIGGIGPAKVWAGSPDETLNPPPPPKKSARLIMGSTTGTSGHPISVRELLSMLLRAYWTTVRL